MRQAGRLRATREQLRAVQLGQDPAGADESGGRLDRLQQLANLHDRGVLNDAEFEAEKAKILGSG